MADLHEVHELHRPPDDRQSGGRDRPGTDLLRTWRPGLVVGVISVGLGIVVALHPTTSLNVVSVFLGVLLLVSGLLYVVRALGGDARHRGWAAIAGAAFVVLGVVLIRHLDVTVLLIALLVGIAWIVQGVVELMAASEERGRTRTWLVIFGSISVVAGIVVIAAPIGSVTVLTVLLGIWWIVLGVLEIASALVMRHELRRISPSRDHTANGSEHLVDRTNRTSPSHRSRSDRPGR